MRARVWPRALSTGAAVHNPFHDRHVEGTDCALGCVVLYTAVESHMRVKHLAALLVAVLVVIPSLSRAQRKLDRRPDLKPTASFRDVDRPPELTLERTNHSSLETESTPVLEPAETVEHLDQPLPNAPRNSRADALRAPPSLL